MKSKLRLATKKDSENILAIYAPYITDTTITFETEIPTANEFRSRVESISAKHPYLVCIVTDEDEAERVVGYAYSHDERKRAAYRWNAELSVYLDPDFYCHGIASAFYDALFSLLKLLGFRNLYSAITLPNEASIALHNRFGFDSIGVHHSTGYKLGGWHDVIWLEKRLPNTDDGTHEPNPPLSIAELDGQVIASILRRAESHINL